MTLQVRKPQTWHAFFEAQYERRFNVGTKLQRPMLRSIPLIRKEFDRAVPVFAETEVQRPLQFGSRYFGAGRSHFSSLHFLLLSSSPGAALFARHPGDPIFATQMDPPARLR
jgi:hypothetical protein